MRPISQILRKVRFLCSATAIGALLFFGCDEGDNNADMRECATGSNTNVMFTAAFTDLDGIDHIQPLGELQAFHNYSAHTYVFIKRDVTEVPVYAPTDMDLINVTDDGQDFGLQFRASCEVAVRFGHITNPIPSIRNLAGSEGQALFDTHSPTLLSISAGELIGTTSGTIQAKSFDFGVYHSGREQNFLNNARFHPVETFRFSTCPYDYYTGDLRNEMYGLFGPKPLSQPLDCRGPRGKAGTIAGPWFDTIEVFDMPYYGQTTVSPLSIATSLNSTIKIVYGLDAEVYRIPLTATTHTDPELVTTEHCYEPTSGGYFYVQLQPDGTLRVIREESGNCPSSFPISGHRTYYR